MQAVQPIRVEQPGPGGTYRLTQVAPVRVTQPGQQGAISVSLGDAAASAAASAASAAAAAALVGAPAGAAIDAHLGGSSTGLITTVAGKVAKGDLVVNVKDYGAVGDGVADDTTAFQAALNAGDTFVPSGTYKITSTLTMPTGRELVGAGAKGSTLTIATDTPLIAWAGGEGQAIRRIRLQSTYTGAFTSFIVDVANPTRPILDYVEVSLPTASTLGGIRFKRDAGLPGANSFMPSLTGLWLRNGRLVVDSVTDGFMSDSWVWAYAVAAPAAIDMSNVADGWTFSNVQVVPCDGTGAGYLFTNSNHAKIIGGYMDGSYDAISTGYGLRATNSGRIFVSGYSFFNCGRSPIRFDNSHGCVVTATGFYRNNKSDASYPDIDLYSSTGNVFSGTSHSQPRNQTNKGGVYREDSSSTKNTFENAILDTSLGNFYGTPLFSGQANTLGRNLKPASLWTRHPGTPNLIAPPATLVSISAPAAWPAANTAIAHRFHVSSGGVFSTANFRVDSGSGNMQAAVIQLSGTSWTRVLTSGIVSCTTGDKTLSLGAAFLDPGEYALVLWCDNTTATFRYVSNSGLTAARLTAEWVDAAGVGTSGTLSWASTKYVGGVTLS